MSRYLEILIAALILVGCATVPITGRKQLSVIPNSQLLPLSYSSYQDVLKESKLSTNQQQVNMVKNVGKNIQRAVEDFMAKNDLADKLNGYAWEFNLIEENTINAWCMPGGKVAFIPVLCPYVRMKQESQLLWDTKLLMPSPIMVRKG
ncbi:MAG: hypothetical protein R2764_03865 [Bacteroidales bacterium]